MGVLESKCPTCGARIVVVFHDRSLETLLVEKACSCAPLKTHPIPSSRGGPPAV